MPGGVFNALIRGFHDTRLSCSYHVPFQCKLSNCPFSNDNKNEILVTVLNTVNLDVGPRLQQQSYSSLEI